MKKIFILITIILLIIIFIVFRQRQNFENKKEYEAIVLIVASTDKQIYNEFKKIWKKYKDSNSNYKVFFVYTKNTAEGLDIDPDCDIIYDDLTENMTDPFNNINSFIKIQRSIKYINENYNYKYIVRTNLSTFWDFNNLDKIIEKLPTENVFYGPPANCYVTGVPFICGAYIIMSKDVAQKVADSTDFRRDLAEDVIIGNIIIEKNKINVTPPFNNNEGVHKNHELTKDNLEIFFNQLETYKSEGVIFYRLKNGDDNTRMDVDVAAHKKLLKVIYDIDI